MKPIETVDQLISTLKKHSPQESYLSIMNRVQIPFREFEKYYNWNADRYTRNCLVKTEDFELLLICYEKGQQTPIHDFSSEQAWIHTIQGKMKEEKFRIAKGSNQLEQVSSMTLGTDDYSYMSDLGIHRYQNIYESRSVTLNLYAQPIEKWTEYDRNGNSKQVSVDYDSVFAS